MSDRDAAHEQATLATIHDPLEREDGSVISMLTVVYAPGAED
jgi:hypothetical protein